MENNNFIAEIERINKKLEEFKECNDKKLNNFYNHLNDTDTKLEKNNLLTEQSTKAIEKMNETMLEVQLTMRDISNELKAGKEKDEQLEENQRTLNKKVDQINRKITNLDEEGKLNVRIWFKEHFVEVVLTCGVVYSIILTSK